MLHKDFEPKTRGEEKDFLIFASISAILIVLHIFFVLFGTAYDVSSDSQADSTDFVIENNSIADSQNIVLQDGGSDIVVTEFASNWSEEGWVLTSVVVTISYSETSTGDADCDTVSAELMISGDSGDEPVTSTITGSVSDCSPIILEMKWQELTGDSEVDYLQTPFEIETDVSLNVDSTIPFNDNDEQIDVSVEVIMSRAQ
jgi:hypothetical protein